jgi:hypothetical protein
MNLNTLIVLEQGIDKIAQATGCKLTEIIDALTGIAWDEEDASKLREYVIDDLADD